MPDTSGTALEGHLAIEHTWDGQPLTVDERVSVRLRLTEAEVQVFVDAPFFDDPAPNHVQGATPALWNHEVVEVFFLGSHERYLEVELGPHGHHLVLALCGVRQVVADQLPLAWQAVIHDAGEVAEARSRRWSGAARFPREWLPPDWTRLNAYAIHGTGPGRRYLAWRPAGGERPDFHVLSSFGERAAAFGASLAPGAPV